LAAVYCRAVLSHDQRIALDGSPTEPVDAEAKDLATKQLAKLAARKAPEPPLRNRVRASLLRRRT
jgi:sRNA-binding protein